MEQIPTHTDAPPAEAAPADPLVDGFGRRHTYLRISLTERCNLRCRYCMPEEGVALTPRAALLTADEIVRLAALFAGRGVDKIRLTGGEPLIRKDIVDIAGRIAALPGVRTLGVTTNGLLLAEKLEPLARAGVRALNVSLDTLDARRFREITRRGGLEQVLEGIRRAQALGYAPVKVNCVVLRGVNDDELPAFAAWAAREPVEVRFIEYMPFAGNRWSEASFLPYAEMQARLAGVLPGLTLLPGAAEDTALLYAAPGMAGRLGFIPSMSRQFCAGCNRLRLTADGALKVCLHGAAEVSLRDALRAGASDADLAALVGQAVGRKQAAHAGAARLVDLENRPMILIGG